MYGVTQTWRNWQLGERAHPVGDEASSIKAQKQGEFRADARKSTMLQESRGHFLRICATTRSVVVAYFRRKYAGVFVLRTSKERKAFFRQRHTSLVFSII